MKEEEIKGFIHTVTGYFNQITEISAIMGLPYIKGYL